MPRERTWKAAEDGIMIRRRKEQRMEKTMNSEQIRKYLEYRRINNRFGNYVGITPVETREGFARCVLEVREEHLNPLNTVHGGCLYTLADTTGGTACATYGTIAPTLSGEMHFLNSASGAKKLIAEANVIKCGRTVRVTEVRITDEKETLIATATFSYFNTGRTVLEDK